MFAVFADELREAYEAKTLATAAKRLAYDLDGFRSVLFSTARKLPDEPAGSWREELIGLDPAWGERATWAAIQRAAAPLTSLYLLAAVDRQVDASGSDRAGAAGAGDLRQHPPAHLLDRLRGHGCSACCSAIRWPTSWPRCGPASPTF